MPFLLLFLVYLGMLVVMGEVVIPLGHATRVGERSGALVGSVSRMCVMILFGGCCVACRDCPGDLDTRLLCCFACVQEVCRKSE